MAVGAGFVHRIAEGFVEPLARHFHEADGRDLKDLGFGLVLFEAVFDCFVDRLLILAVAHVDEVDHDEAADVAEAELACDFASGLDVGFENHLVDILGAAVAAGVHIDGDERFGFIDHHIAAAGQPDLA